jgi:hypothetical protein
MPDPSVDRADEGEIGTAYRIRTGDLRLERAVSWASRRMRRRGTAGVPPRPTGMIPTTSRRRHRSEAVCVQETPDRFGHLLVALFAEDEPVVGVRPERLVFRPEPLSKPL